MSKPHTPVEEQTRNLLKYLYALSPACNELVQMFFITPQKATTLAKMYPELMEKEDVLMELFGLRYDEKGFVEPSSWRTPIAYHLADLFRSLFRQLSHPDKRRSLLDLANVKEDEFKEFDPLRAWLDIGLQFMAENSKDALKVLEAAVAKLSGKGPDEYVRWEEVKGSVGEVKDFEACMKALKHFFLLPWESSSLIYARECPLTLEAYSDLRAELKELSR